MTYEWTEQNLKYWEKTLKFYDITPKQLNDLRRRLIVAQSFKCGVCGKDLSGKTCYLDHDHHTGEVRGIACFVCNRYRVAKNTTDTALEVVRYLSNPPARELLPSILKSLKVS